ncbi:hypothetical protein J0H58_18210 [bacterium]|nr:hypothetical protein [bacterium]
MRPQLTSVLLLVLVQGMALSRPTPLPPNPATAPIVSHGLKLEAAGTGVLLFRPESRAENTQVRLTLTNTRDAIREVEELMTLGNRVDRCPGITYLIRYDDGATLELHPYLPVMDDPQAGNPKAYRPLALPRTGYAHGVVDLRNSLSGDFLTHFWRTDGRFNLTAVAVALDLRSNTVAYNGAAEPPRGFDALAETRRLRAVEAAAREARRQRWAEQEQIRLRRQLDEQARPRP